jgi:hypothetical protein
MCSSPTDRRCKWLARGPRSEWRRACWSKDCPITPVPSHPPRERELEERRIDKEEERRKRKKYTTTTKR